MGWTENPNTFASMQLLMTPLANTMKAPPLQPRLTQFHGTRVPVIILLFLQSTEASRLAATDKFFGRTTKHKILWRALHCRDHNVTVNGCRGRCSWHALNGKADGMA